MPPTLPLSGDSHGQDAAYGSPCKYRRNAAPRFGAEREGPRLELHCGHRRETTSRRARLRLIVLVATLAAMLIAPAAAHADATLSTGLADAAAGNPDQVFRVIVQGDPGHRSQDVADDVDAAKRSDPGQGIGLKRRLVSIDGVSAELTGKQILRLSHKHGILAISVDQPVRITSQPGYSSLQRWPYASGAAKFWTRESLLTGEPARDRRRRLGRRPERPGPSRGA